MSIETSLTTKMMPYMTNNKIKMNQIDILLNRYPSLKLCKEDIAKAYEMIANSYEEGGKLLICGNGGSAADAEHIVGELMKGFKKKRPIPEELYHALLKIDAEKADDLVESLQGGLPAIALDGHPALTTAFINDCNPLMGFAQQVNGYGNEGDVFLGISTSGNSKNVVYAAMVAKAKGLKIIGFTGEKQSELYRLADVCIRVPETETYMIQELHLPVYHCLCLMLEERFFEK